MPSFAVAHWNEPPMVVDEPVFPASVSFGDVNLGRSAERSVRIINPSTSTATLDVRLELPESPFSLVDSVRHVQIAPGYSRDVRVRFVPDHLGVHGQGLIVRHNAPGGRGTILLEGNGLPLKVVPHIPAPVLDFGECAVGFIRDTIIMVGNDSTSNAAVTFHLREPGGAFDLPDTVRWIVVAPGETRSVRVRFSPRSKGETSDSLALLHDGGPESTLVTIGLHGIGVEPSASVRVSMVDVAFDATRTGDTMRARIVIGSDATSTRSLFYRSRPLKEPFAIVATDGELAAGEEDTLLVAFAPTAGGLYFDTLTIEHDGANESSPIRIPVRGVSPTSGISTDNPSTTGAYLSVRPNPSNGIVRMDLHLDRRARVRLELSTESGSLVRVLVDGEYSEGDHSISWETSELPVGVYLVRLRVGEFLVSKKLVIIR